MQPAQPQGPCPEWMDLTTSSPHLLVFRDTRDQLMWLDQPCSAFDIVVVDSVVVLHDHCELVHDFSTELGKVATVSKFQQHGPFKKAQWGLLYFIETNHSRNHSVKMFCSCPRNGPRSRTRQRRRQLARANVEDPRLPERYWYRLALVWRTGFFTEAGYTRSVHDRKRW